MKETLIPIFESLEEETSRGFVVTVPNGHEFLTVTPEPNHFGRKGFYFWFREKKSEVVEGRLISNELTDLFPPSECVLNKRIVNALRRRDIVFVTQLASLSVREIRHTRNLGGVSIRIIRDVMLKHGIRLKELP